VRCFKGSFAMDEKTWQAMPEGSGSKLFSARGRARGDARQSNLRAPTTPRTTSISNRWTMATKRRGIPVPSREPFTGPDPASPKQAPTDLLSWGRSPARAGSCWKRPLRAGGGVGPRTSGRPHCRRGREAGKKSASSPSTEFRPAVGGGQAVRLYHAVNENARPLQPWERPGLNRRPR